MLACFIIRPYFKFIIHDLALFIYLFVIFAIGFIAIR